MRTLAFFLSFRMVFMALLRLHSVLNFILVQIKVCLRGILAFGTSLAEIIQADRRAKHISISFFMTHGFCVRHE